MKLCVSVKKDASWDYDGLEYYIKLTLEIEYYNKLRMKYKKRTSEKERKKKSRRGRYYTRGFKTF